VWDLPHFDEQIGLSRYSGSSLRIRISQSVHLTMFESCDFIVSLDVVGTQL